MTTDSIIYEQEINLPSFQDWIDFFVYATEIRVKLEKIRGKEI